MTWLVEGGEDVREREGGKGRGEGMMVNNPTTSNKARHLAAR